MTEAQGTEVLARLDTIITALGNLQTAVNGIHEAVKWVFLVLCVLMFFGIFRSLLVSR